MEGEPSVSLQTILSDKATTICIQEALLKALDVKKTFPYVYLGGAVTEPDQEKTWWFYSEGRRVRVRPCPFPYNAFYSPSCDMLTLLRGLPRQKTWSLESRTRM